MEVVFGCNSAGKKVRDHHKRDDRELGAASRCWCARLDSNQRPTESELSGRQGRNPDFMRVSGTSHKISSHLQKPGKPLVRLGSYGFSGFGKIVVKQ